MIARRNRLARADFPTLLKSGKRAFSEHFSIIYSDVVCGYAVIVSKKIIKTAIGRHLIKRRVFSILCANTTPRGCVVFAQKGAQELSFSKIKKEINLLLGDITV